MSLEVAEVFANAMIWSAFWIAAGLSGLGFWIAARGGWTVNLNFDEDEDEDEDQHE